MECEQKAHTALVHTPIYALMQVICCSWLATHFVVEFVSFVIKFMTKNPYVSDFRPVHPEFHAYWLIFMSIVRGEWRRLVIPRRLDPPIGLICAHFSSDKLQRGSARDGAL